MLRLNLPERVKPVEVLQWLRMKCGIYLRIPINSVRKSDLHTEFLSFKFKENISHIFVCISTNVDVETKTLFSNMSGDFDYSVHHDFRKAIRPPCIPVTLVVLGPE